MEIPTFDPGNPTELGKVELPGQLRQGLLILPDL